MSSAPNHPILNDSESRILFEGARRFRTREGILGIALGLAGAAWFTGFAFIPGLTRIPGLRIICGLMAAGFFAGFIYWSWSWFTNRAVGLRITEKGIVYGRKRWAWGRIGEVGGYRYPDGVHLYLELPLKGRGSVRAAGIHRLTITPGLSESQFSEVATELAHVLAISFPHVRINFTLRQPPPAPG